MDTLDWQPIETAPKDGTPILVRSKGNPLAWNAACRKPFYRVDAHMKHHFKQGRNGFGRETKSSPYTHWMPIPEVNK